MIKRQTQHLVRRIGWCSVVLAAALVVGGCTSPRDALGPSVSPCFSAIALGRTEMGPVARFAGVSYTSEPSIKSALSRAGVHIRLPRVKDRLCVVAFWGTLKGARAKQTGLRNVRSMALVIVSLRPSRVLAKVAISRLPYRFGRPMFEP